MTDRDVRRGPNKRLMLAGSITFGTLAALSGIGLYMQSRDGEELNSPASPGPVAPTIRSNLDPVAPQKEIPNDFVDIKFPGFSGYYPSLAHGRWGKEAFVQNGVGFRLSMQVLADRQDPRLAQMRELYNKLKGAYGKEYTENGEVFEPKVGEKYYIIDGAEEHPGIYLRTKPTIGPSGNSFLYHGMTVEVTSDPIAIPDLRDGVKIMYGIKVVNEGNFIDTDIRAKVGSVGYVSSEWLGSKVKDSSLAGKPTVY